MFSQLPAAFQNRESLAVLANPHQATSVTAIQRSKLPHSSFRVHILYTLDVSIIPRMTLTHHGRNHVSHLPTCPNARHLLPSTAPQPPISHVLKHMR